MKGALIHGALLGVMLVYGYRTWTKKEAAKPTTGEVVMWTRGEADLTKLEFQSDKRTVRIERRGQGADAHWWGIETKTTKKPKPPEAPPVDPTATDPAKPGDPAKPADPAKPGDPAKPADPAKPGDPAKPADPAAAKPPADPAAPPADPVKPADPPVPPAEPEMITETTTTEFPIGPEGEKLVKQYTSMRAIKSLGVPTDEVKKDYALTESQTSIAVVFGDGAKTLVVGGKVYGGSDRYLMDLDNNKVFVVLGTMVSLFEGGEISLRPTDLRPFDPKTATQIEIAAAQKTKTVSRIKVKAPDNDGPDPHKPPTPPGGDLIETWGEGTTADTTAANFIDKIEKLRPSSFDPKIDVASLEPIAVLTYKDAKGKQLGTLKLLRRKKAMTPNPDGSVPPMESFEYFLWTERTRVPAPVPPIQAERVEQDVPTLFAATTP